MTSFIQQSRPILTTGVIELVGINELVADTNYSASVEIPIDVNGQASGEILSVLILAREVGSGAVLRSPGELLLFDSDPTIALNATALASLDIQKIIGNETFAVADYAVADDLGDHAWKAVAIAFSNTKSLWATFRLASATAINSAAGDDETLELIMRYRRDS